VTALYRLSGAGNDFLALVEPEAPPAAETIRAWCRRGVSLGADGVVALRRAAGGASGVELDYWNADGGWAALCVNATRSAAQLAFELGWAEGRVTVRTGAGPFGARRVSSDEVELEMAPAEGSPRAITLVVDGRALSCWAFTVGVPHVVLPWVDELGSCPVAALGPPIRRHAELGPPGANVNFVRFEAPHGLDIRTYERGVEAETLACGSGVLAAVAVGVATGALALPVRARTKGGFPLTVAGASAGGAITRWSMAGDARVLARLEAFPAAVHLPAAPTWE
jgi:diaminopimelate epimerase